MSGLGMIANNEKTVFYYGNYNKIKEIILNISKQDKKSRITLRNIPDDDFSKEYINEIKKLNNINFVEV